MSEQQQEEVNTELSLQDEETVDIKPATLEMTSERPVDVGGATADDVEFRSGNIHRDRPFSASTMSRKSTHSTTSKTTMSPNLITSEHSTKLMFSYKSQVFETAVEEVQAQCIKVELDGQTRGAWLLTEINHWDLEREKVVVLTDFSLFIVRYDFINKRLGEWRRIFLHLVESLRFGNIVYPPNSIMVPRDHGGIRLSWKIVPKPTMGQKWNPFCTSLPQVTLAHHPLLYSEKERETITYNVDDLCDSIILAAREAHTTKATGRALNVEEAPITIESYASVASLIFNQSFLGFNRDRNGLAY